MDDMKKGSIWDEVDALREDKEDVTKREAYVENKSETAAKVEAKTTFRVINSSPDGHNLQQNTQIKENKTVSEPVRKIEPVWNNAKDNDKRSDAFEMIIERDDNADKKGIMCIAVTLLCVAAIVASILGIVKLASDRNRDIKDAEATMERLQSMKEPAEGDMQLSGGAGYVWDDISFDYKQQ